MTTWAKLNSGEWGIRGTGLEAGQTVEVARRDGSVSSVTVLRILWTGTDGVQLASIVSQGAPQARAYARRRYVKGHYRHYAPRPRGRCEDAPCCGCCN